MGRPMAANLVKAGHDVTVWNRTPKSVEGARTAATPAEAAKDAEVVWMCVADTNAVETILFGPGGIEAMLRPGVTVIDSSTISPLATRDFAARVRSKGAEFVDAPVTGSKVGAENAQLLFIVGGPEKTVAALNPLFMALGKQVIRVGETGAGESAKIGMNLMIASIFEGFAEALALTGKLGVAAGKTRRVDSGFDDSQRGYRLQGQFRAEPGLVAEFSVAVDAQRYSPDARRGQAAEGRIACAEGDREDLSEGSRCRSRERGLCGDGGDGEKPVGIFVSNFRQQR